MLTKHDKREHVLIFALILINILVGLIILNDFGQSWDEFFDWLYGGDAVRAYSGSTEYMNYKNRHFYGPLHLMIGETIATFAIKIQDFWTKEDIRHFVNFLAFQSGLIAFYYLCRKMLSQNASIVGTALLALQPVIFGYAFINQKDTPFMASFIISISLGISAVNYWKQNMTIKVDGANQEIIAQTISLTANIRGDWKVLSIRKKYIFIGINAVLLLLVIDIFSKGVIFSFLNEQIQKAYDYQGLSITNWLFQKFAIDAWKTPLGIYLRKFELVYSWTRVIISWVLVFLFLVISLILLRRTSRIVLSNYVNPVGMITLAAIAVGASTSIRNGGLFAGCIILLYALLELGWKRSIPPMFVYVLVGGSFVFLTWPYLWEDSITRFVGSVELMANFPIHRVLFEGLIFGSNELPRRYLPKLLSILLTEPAVILSVIGIMISPFILWKERRNMYIILLIWFLLPFLAVVIRRTPIYGNIRQFLFAIPPLFVFAGISIDNILGRLSKVWFKVLFAAIVILPGTIGIISLHPYEYSYFNSFVGGIDGAFGKYHVDHWCISYREAMEYVNKEAPYEAQVIVYPPMEAARTYARDDLTVIADITGEGNPDYALLCRLDFNNATNTTSKFYNHYQIVHEIKRGDAILAIVLKRPEK